MSLGWSSCAVLRARGRFARLSCTLARMQNSIVVRIYAAALCLAFANACGPSSNAPAEPPASAPPSAAAQPAPKPEPAAAPGAAAGATPSAVDDAAFLLRLNAAGSYKAGELGRVVLELQTKGPYHVNQEYPLEISITSGADTTLPKAKFERADAAEFTKTKARFEVPLTAKAAGSVAVNANVKFAVCTDENCVPDERNLSLVLAVQ